MIRLVVYHGIGLKPRTWHHPSKCVADFLFKRVPLQDVWEKFSAREACIIRSLVLVEYEEVGDTICGELSATEACSALVRHSNREVWSGLERLVPMVKRRARSALSLSRDMGIVQKRSIGGKGQYIFDGCRVYSPALPASVRQ